MRSASSGTGTAAYSPVPYSVGACFAGLVVSGSACSPSRRSSSSSDPSRSAPASRSARSSLSAVITNGTHPGRNRGFDAGWRALDHGTGDGFDSDRGRRIQEQVGRRLAVGDRIRGEPDVLRKEMVEAGDLINRPYEMALAVKDVVLVMRSYE